MRLNLLPPSPLEYFTSLVQSDAELPLLEAVVSLAQDEYPDLDLEHSLSVVDKMQSRLRKRNAQNGSVLERIHQLNQFFYGELGFALNTNDYYDPDNSYLHHVLETRRGIPISIGVLWLELARSIGLDVYGVSFPGHFMLKVLLAQGQVILDPLTGKSFSSQELTHQLQAQIPRLSLYNEETMPLGLFLQSASPREILTRMLRNLKEIFRVQQDGARQLAVMERLVILLPKDWIERRDRGLAYEAVGRTQEAMVDFQSYLDFSREALDATEIAQKLQALKNQA
ncbi:tetratricopeptide repeat protein [Lampropedia puyangensis]|uniref:Tetratricopeptide repeat protein n=2 Tax=Lampropedia puyangensis TaxID=1330072 RepID=A0A4S8FET8_9BURK|nr:tetratricopeptide repeat protein [Lampropedia puyangensis]THU05541.1 tetratricopeptide repeat protein [Lampropedia puyangensis]